MERTAAAAAIEAFLRALAIDPEPELVGTGDRVASLWIDELLDGYRADVAKLLRETIPVIAGTPLVSVERVATHVICPHHLTIGRGHASVFYLPNDRMVGLGAIASVVDACTHRLVLQEEAGERIAQSLVTHLGARGAACMLLLRHGCMEHHGQKRRGSRVRTISMTGSFGDRGADRALALAAIRAAR